jgi:hypothetical protein
MISRIKLYIAALAVGFAAAWQVILLIRRDERKNVELERANGRLDAIEEADRIRDDVEIDPHIVDRSRKWLRKKD